MLLHSMPPVMNCPFCEKPVEIVTLQRSPDDVNICVVSYYHSDGDQHFVSYIPRQNESLTYDNSGSSETVKQFNADAIPHRGMPRL